jgi:hypothetical protein
MWIEATAGFAVGLGAALFVTRILLKHYLPSYLSEKGKNLATKEDIADITDKVAKVQHGYNDLLETLKARNQLRLAAVERRLQAHQESFELWRRLVFGGPEVIVECERWWEKNCLYLEPKVREAFVAAYRNEHIRQELVSSKANSDSIIQSSAVVRAFPDVLFAAIALPPLSELERTAVTDKV